MIRFTETKERQVARGRLDAETVTKHSVTPRRGSGRPPKGDRAMTVAERVRAYRERKARAKG